MVRLRFQLEVMYRRFRKNVRLLERDWCPHIYSHCSALLSFALCVLKVLIPEILVMDQNHGTALTSHVDVENTLGCLVSVSLV